MAQFTFEGNKEAKCQKEKIEWLNIWCEDTDDETLPRVAIIGDSITHQSFDVVKRELAGVAKVDLISTSYSILSPAYKAIIEAFLNDSKYAAVHYNYGLHAYNVSDDEYEEAYRDMLKTFLARCKVVVGLTTTVLQKPDLERESESDKPIVEGRNARAVKLAKEFGLVVDDLHSLCPVIGKEGKQADGVHFNEQGNEVIGKSIAESLKKVL